MSYTKDLQDKLVQYETIAEAENERTPMEERNAPIDTSQNISKEDMWQNLINFAFDNSAGNVAHWTTHRQPNTAPMARRVPRRRG
jgi:hypothetical protein